MKKEKYGLEEPIMIKIKIVRNGCYVTACKEDTGDEQEYVYEKLQDAMKEIPSIVDVMMQEKRRMTERDLEDEEENISKGIIVVKEDK